MVRGSVRYVEGEFLTDESFRSRICETLEIVERGMPVIDHLIV